MSSINETSPEESTDHETVIRDFTAPNGEHLAAIATGKLLHLPAFERHEEDSSPTDHLPTAS